MDLFILITFVLITLITGIYQGIKSKNIRDYYLGGKKIHWFYLSISIVATETSSLTFLGIPALSYQGDYSFLSIAIGFILGRFLVAFLFLPYYFQKNYISIYEWIGEFFGNSSQKTLSLVFCIIRILADGVRLYATSLPLSFLLAPYFPESMNFFQISLISLVILTGITIIYSAYGGFRAVIWTDFLQFFVYFCSGIAVLFFLIQTTGIGIGELLFQSSYLSPEKKQIFQWNWLDKNHQLNPYFIFFSIPGGILLSIGSHGTDQMMVQRLLACKTLKQARLALVLSGFLVFFQFGLFLVVGSYLWVGGVVSEVQNFIFPSFISNQLPTLLKGLILSGVLASSMSTLSSSLNSLALTTKIDLKVPSNWITDKWLTVVWGILLFFSSVTPFGIEEAYRKNIVELGLSFSSLVFGALVSIFLLRFTLIESNFYQIHIPFPFLIFLSIFFTVVVYFYYSFPFTLLTGLGILIFFSFYLAFVSFRVILIK